MTGRTDDSSATAWRDRVEGLLYDGERELDRVDLEGGTVVVTSHRVLAFTPGADGPRFRQVDRPNVARVGVDAGGDSRLLVRALAAAAVGAGLLATATWISVADLVGGLAVGDDPASGSGTGVAGVASETLETLESVLALVDLAILVAGIGALALAAALGGWYAWTQSRSLVVGVRGDDDVAVPIREADLADDAVARLEAAIRPDAELETAATAGDDREESA